MRLAGFTRPALPALVAVALLTGCKTTADVSEGAPEAAQETQAGPVAAGAAPANPAAALPEPAGATPADAEPEATPAPAATPPSGPAPHIYMSLQPAGSGMPISVIFAIDVTRDGTPSDDPAIRITPDGGLCNPQEMRQYNFPPADAARPVVTEADQARGLTAVVLPEFMAVAVTDRMLAEGLATDREQTRPHNICTRKLWERLVTAQTATTLAAGQ